MRRTPSLILAAVAVCVAAGCGGPDGGDGVPPSDTTRPRRTVVWIGPEGLDLEWAERLQRVGVDGLVVTRGRVLVRDRTPVLRLDPPPAVAGSIPVAVALRVEIESDEIDPEVAASMWAGLVADPDWAAPSELVVDLPRVVPGTADLLAALAEVSSTSVVPVLTVDQLVAPDALEVVRRTGTCVVPAFGTGASWLRGLDGSPVVVPLRERLATLAASGARVRIAVSTVPRTDPSTDGWGDDLGPLADPEAADVSTSSTLDRTFVLRRALDWSGRRWEAGERIAVRWFDASRLNAAFEESARVVLPEIAGWDVVRLPPRPQGLGMGREALVRYLGGEGPQPRPELTVERDGRAVRVRLSNPTSFGSAVTTVGNFVEVSVASGALVAEDRGDFDGVELGTVRGGDFRSAAAGRYDAVRLVETYLAPGESLESGPVRMPTSSSQVTVRWQVMVTSGQRLVGRVVP